MVSMVSAPSISTSLLDEPPAEDLAKTKPLSGPSWRDKILQSETIAKPVCIIPAKKLSVRLPGKNKALVGGKPLVMHAIDVAKASDIFSMIIVSSDDEDVLEMAYEAGVFPHKRPAFLLKPSLQMKDICLFVMKLSQVPKADVFCLLPPPNPFRTAKDLRDGYEMIWEKDANYVMTVVRSLPPPQLGLRMAKGYLVPERGFEYIKQAQKLEPLYRHDGAFIFARREVFEIEYEYGFYGSKVLPMILPRKTIDIDTEDDLLYARYLWGEKR